MTSDAAGLSTPMTDSAEAPADSSGQPDDVADVRSSASSSRPRIVVVGPDGMAVSEGEDSDGGSESITAMVEQPAKVMRIGSMIKQLLEEVKSAPLDDASRVRLKQIHENSIHELEQGLSTELVGELHRLSLPFSDDSTPSDAELRIAQAQLVGWLEGLFHGIQTMLFAQQMAARQQLEQMRRALPPGMSAPGQEEPDGRETRSGGMYL